MLESTKGIFLHHIPYSDTSVIATIYTEKYGQLSFLVNGIRSKKAGSVINLFQPLFLLDLVISYKQGRNLQRIRDVRLAVPFTRILFDIKRSSQAIFIAEILLKCMKEEEANPELFSFLFHAICLLDLKDEGIANFLIVFLFRLTRYLGVFPQMPGSGSFRFFDLVSSSFRMDEPAHHSFMNADTTLKFSGLFRIELSELEKLSLKNEHRTVLMSKLLEYYRIHLDLTGEIKSFAVLKEVLE